MRELETIMFSKRQIQKIHRDQYRLNQFIIKKNIAQQLNYYLQEFIKSMQTGSDEGKVEIQVVLMGERVDYGRGDSDGEGLAEQVPVPDLSHDRDPGGTEVGEGRRYTGRLRKKPNRFKDFEMDESGEEGIWAMNDSY